MSCPRTLGRFLTYGFDSFLGLFANSFRRLLRFLSDSFRRLLGFLAYGLDSFFDFPPAFFAPCLMSWTVSSCPKPASAPAVSKATIKPVILMIFLLFCNPCTKETD